MRASPPSRPPQPPKIPDEEPEPFFTEDQVVKAVLYLCGNVPFRDFIGSMG